MNQLTKKQRQALEEYLDGSIDLDSLAKSLDCVMEISFRDQERHLTTHYGTPEPEIRVNLTHLHNAMERHADGEITTEQLADWAAMLLLNDAYGWEGPEQDEIAELLNEISNLTLKPHSPME